MRTRRIWLTSVSIIVVLVAIGGYLATRPAGGSANVDGRLRAPARAIAPELARTEPDYVRAPAFAIALRRYVNHVRALVRRLAARWAGRHQFAQVLILDPASFPPVAQLITASNAPGPIALPQASTDVALLHRRTVFLDARLGSRTYRAYLSPLHLPPLFAPRRVTGVLEIFQLTA